jgi:dephospho-CoA kinase
VDSARKALVVGLTGPIGAGKSAVAALLAAKGVPVIDADELGREVWNASDQLKAALAATFGPPVLTPDGSIDRQALAREAFASEEATARLNDIVHPFLWARLTEEIAAHGNDAVVVVDAALIVEWRDSLPVDVVVVVDAPEDVRRERSRHKYDDGDFSVRQARQLDAASKRAAAHIVLDNSGSPAELAVKADLLYNMLSAIAESGHPPAETLVI